MHKTTRSFWGFWLVLMASGTSDYISQYRPQYYDRNPVDRSIAYENTNIAPHVQTNRATRTIGANEQAILESIALKIRRNQVATAAGRCAALIQYTPSGGAAETFAIEFLPMNTATGAVGDASPPLVFYVGKVLNPGDVVSILTLDGSTGGSTDIYTKVSMTGFDKK